MTTLGRIHSAPPIYYTSKQHFHLEAGQGRRDAVDDIYCTSLRVPFEVPEVLKSRKTYTGIACHSCILPELEHTYCT